MANRLVIGAASGMGQAVAHRFAKRTQPGDRLMLADRSAEALRSVAAQCGAESAECDVTSDAQVAAVCEAIGEVDEAVLTAGLSPTMGAGARILEVNLPGTARVAQALLARMRSGGALVVFASTAGHMLGTDAFDTVLNDPLDPQLYNRLRSAGANVDDPAMAYVVSKYGVRRYVRRQAGAWGARGARIVSVSPGIIETPMGAQEFRAQPAMADMVSATPLRRLGGADEVAAVACFLTSAEASFVTGCDLLVDGGFIGSIS